MGLAAIAADVGAEADRAASDAAPGIADERTAARAKAADERKRAEAEARADDEAAAAAEDEDGENVHADSDDDIIDLDEPDPEDGADGEQESSVTWSEVQARYDRLRGDASSSKKSKKRKAKKTRKAKKKRATEPEPVAEAKADEAPAPAGPAGAFDRDAATSAMFGAAGGASSCATEGGPSGRGRVSVTLSPSGSVSSVDVSGPFAGTKTGSCIASLFRSISVPPFTGGAVALQKSFNVRAAKAAVSADDDEPEKKKRSKAKKSKKKKKKPSKRRSGRRRGRARR